LEEVAHDAKAVVGVVNLAIAGAVAALGADQCAWELFGAFAVVDLTLDEAIG
jgi:hypothetical protein